MTTDESSDIVFINLLRIGDRSAFESIYRKYAADVFRYIGDRVEQRSDCEEITIDVFVHLWEHRGEINESISLKDQINSMTKYKLFEYVRDHPESDLYRWLSERCNRTGNDQ